MNRRSGTAAALALFVALAAWLVPGVGSAHPAYLTVGEAAVDADGRFRLIIRFDTLAFALNDTSARIGNAPMEELLNGPHATLAARLADARGRFQGGFHVETDSGPGVVESIEFPDAAQVAAWRSTVKPVLPVVLPVRVTGRLPGGAHTVAFRFPAVLEQVILTVERPGEEPYAEPVDTGAASTSLPLSLARPSQK